MYTPSSLLECRELSPVSELESLSWPLVWDGRWLSWAPHTGEHGHGAAGGRQTHARADGGGLGRGHGGLHNSVHGGVPRRRVPGRHEPGRIHVRRLHLGEQASQEAPLGVEERVGLRQQIGVGFHAPPAVRDVLEKTSKRQGCL